MRIMYVTCAGTCVRACLRLLICSGQVVLWSSRVENYMLVMFSK